MSTDLKPISVFGLEKLANLDFNDIVLSVILSNDGLIFLYLHDNKEVAFEVFNFSSTNFDKIVKSSVSLAKSFKAVHIVFDNRLFMMLPNNSARESQKNSIASVLFGENNLRNFFRNFNSMDIVFGVDKELYSLVIGQWKDAIIHHYAEAFYESITKQIMGKEQVFFDIRKDFFWAALFDNGKMKLFNSYEFSGKSDFGFFGLGVIKNMGFNPKELQLYLSGNIRKDAPLESLLKIYIQDIQHIESESIIKEFVFLQYIINFLRK